MKWFLRVAHGSQKLCSRFEVTIEGRERKVRGKSSCEAGWSIACDALFGHRAALQCCPISSEYSFQPNGSKTLQAIRLKMENNQAALAAIESQMWIRCKSKSIWKVTERFLSGKSSIHGVNVHKYSYPPQSLNPRANPIITSMQPRIYSCSSLIRKRQHMLRLPR